MIISCCNGKHFNEGLLTIRKAGESALEYLQITMKEVLISSTSTGGSSEKDQITENVTFNFAEFEVECAPQSADGSGDAAIEVSWSIAANTRA